MQVDVTKGAQRVRAWPGPRGPAKTQGERERQERWRVVQWATKYLPAIIQQQAREAVAGTALLPRDLLVMQLYGRLVAVQYDDGRTLYPMTARQDISDSLDILSQIPATLLVRGPDFWEGVAIGSAGQFLAVNAEADNLEWVTGLGSSGLVALASHTTGAGETTVTFTGLNQFYTSLVIDIRAGSTSNVTTSSQSASMRFNNDSSARYDYVGKGRFPGGSFFNDANSATSMGAMCLLSSTGAGLKIGEARITIPRYAEANDSHTALSQNTAIQGNVGILGMDGQGMWRPASAQAITRLDFIASGAAFSTGSKFTVYGL